MINKNKSFKILSVVIAIIFIVVCYKIVSYIRYNNSVLFPIYQNGKTGYMNYQGKIKIKPKYLYGYAFYEGLAAAEDKNNHYGYINLKGQFVIKSQFEWAEPFQNGYAKVVTLDGKNKYINKKGNIVVPPKDYEQNLKNEKGEGYKIVAAKYLSKSGIYVNRYGYKNSNGKIVIPCIYNLALDFSDGLALVQTDKRAFYFINKKGQIVLTYPDTYVPDDYFYHGLLHIRINDKWTYVNHKGKIINPHY